ncbi:MAG: pyridoxal-phosphate dependent enzyme [Ekhidna sp.]
MVTLPTPLQEISHPILKEQALQVFVKRDDQIHAEIMGNKWRKLKYNLQHAFEGGYEGLLTMGGAFSNHIAATAAAAFDNGLKSIGIIRGDELNTNSNATLQFASEKGMQLRFVTREQFRNWRENTDEIVKRYPAYFFLPEGGTNAAAIEGCQEIVSEIEMDFDIIACPVGTGGTVCGLISSISSGQKVLGFSALKGEFMTDEVQNLLREHQLSEGKYEIVHAYHFGGYAKTTSQLIDFINWFKETFGIQLDPIYTGKCFFGVWDMIKSNKFEKNLRIVLLHTGGLQGIEGFNRKNANIIQ